MSLVIVTDAETLRTLIAEELAKALANQVQTQMPQAVEAVELLTVEEAAERLKCSAQHVYREISEGRIPALRTGKRQGLLVKWHETAEAIAAR